MDKVNIDDMIAKNLEKVNKKRAKQGLPPAKVTQNATASLKAIGLRGGERKKPLREVKKERSRNRSRESSKYYNTNAKLGKSSLPRQRWSRSTMRHMTSGNNKGVLLWKWDYK